MGKDLKRIFMRHLHGTGNAGLGVCFLLLFLGWVLGVFLVTLLSAAYQDNRWDINISILTFVF